MKNGSKIGLRLPGKLVSLLREVGLIILFAITTYLFVCLNTYSSSDPGPTHTGNNSEIMNMGGEVGAWFADLMFTLFGRMAYLFLILLGVIGWRLYQSKDPKPLESWAYLFTGAGFILAMAGACSLKQIYFPFQNTQVTAGGIIGQYSAEVFIGNFGIVGATVILLALFITGITLVGHVSWFHLMDLLGYKTFMIVTWIKEWLEEQIYKKKRTPPRKERQGNVQTIRTAIVNRKTPKIAPQISAPAESPRKQKERQTTIFKVKAHSSHSILPGLSLMDTPTLENHGYSREKLETMSQLLIKKLKDFNVDATVKAFQPGPVITRFEIEPAPGIKASQISGLSKDLARSLSVVSVRIVENIPGKAVIGIEIPNENRELVCLVEGISSNEYNNSTSPLTLVLGKNIVGHTVIADLIKMPHVLIAGTTGAGKSVCIHAMILSLVYKSTPEQVRMIMVDPKFLELSVYNGIPHLLTPVVTDMNKAVNVLRWCIVEMDRRFRVMASFGVRNIASFNKKVEVASKSGELVVESSIELEKMTELELLDRLPYIVVLVDELADLMMVAGKKIEEIIIRIAQRARAAGIHLVLATQRPSVDVVTGLIKANVPTRIAFQASSRVDSRTVLDQIGAEQLLGQGDMLYLPPGSGFTQRVHGSFVSDEEVVKVVKQLKSLGKPIYLDEVTANDSGEEALEAKFSDRSVKRTLCMTR